MKILTAQLEESNPVLTAISDAMTAEADARAMAESSVSKEEKAKYDKQVENYYLVFCLFSTLPVSSSVYLVILLGVCRP